MLAAAEQQHSINAFAVPSEYMPGHLLSAGSAPGLGATPRLQRLSEIELDLARRILFRVNHTIKIEYKVYKGDYKALLEVYDMSFLNGQNLYYSQIPRATGHLVNTETGQLRVIIPFSLTDAHLQQEQRENSAYERDYNRKGELHCTHEYGPYQVHLFIGNE